MKTIVFGLVCFAVGLTVALKHFNYILTSRTEQCVANSYKDKELHTKAKYLCNNIQCYGFAVDSYVLSCLTK
jgi:uncharacterized membrane protein